MKMKHGETDGAAFRTWCWTVKEQRACCSSMGTELTQEVTAS